MKKNHKKHNQKQNQKQGAAKLGLDLLFPRRCPICDDAVSPFGGDICLACEKKAAFITEPYCLKCGKKIQEEHEGYCLDCTKKKHLFIKGAAVFEYRAMAASIYRFKYGHRQEYADYYGRIIAKRLGRRMLSWNPQALIPVPIHAERRKKRGYNQSELIAEAVGRELGIKVVTDLVKRVKKTAPQKQLNERERQNNLKKAFKLSRNDVELNTVIIIDDIYTTGSTIDAITQELNVSGIANVYFVALAIGKGF